MVAAVELQLREIQLLGKQGICRAFQLEGRQTTSATTCCHLVLDSRCILT